MNEPRDFLALTSFGSVGSVLLGLGLLGCLLHRESSRLLASAVVALAGALLILDGAQRFHGAGSQPHVSLAVVACGTAVAFFVRSTTQAGSRTSTRDNSSPDSTKSPKSGGEAANADS